MAILKTTGSNAGRLNFHFYVAHPTGLSVPYFPESNKNGSLERTVLGGTSCLARAILGESWGGTGAHVRMPFQNGLVRIWWLARLPTLRICRTRDVIDIPYVQCASGFALFDVDGFVDLAAVPG